MSGPSQTGGAETPQRVLGPFSATCIVIGAIIGVGIFFNPSRVAALTESPALALGAWALAGAIAMCGAMTFAALGQRYFASGAQYEVIRDGYGAGAGFVFVLCNATAIQAGAIGVIALVCAANLLTLVGSQDPPGGLSLGVALGLIALVTGANIAGVKWGSRLQVFTVVAKVAALVFIVGLAVFARPDAPAEPVAAAAPANPETPSKMIPGLGGVVAALVPAFFAFGGWQHALWISGEVREPRRNLPRAILVGMVIVIAVYVSANWAYLALLGQAGVAGSATLASDAVAAVFPEGGRRLIAAAVAISALGVLNAQLLAGPRLVYRMAADGRFFARFARLHGRFKTPAAAILLLGVVGAGLLAAVGDDRIDTLTAGSVFVDGIFFVLTGIALLRLRATPESPFLPGAKIAAVIFVIGELGVLVGAFLARDARAAAVGGLIWVAAAALVYLVCFRKRAG